MGVRNCSFPLFVSEDVLQREKDHIEGFAAEVAWVTHAYGSDEELRLKSAKLTLTTEALLLSRKRLPSVLHPKRSCTPTTQNGFEATVTFLCD
jgi:prolyl-tRNA synthetase